MSQKIEILKKILKRLEKTWRMSEWIVLLLENNELSEDMIDNLLIFLHKTIKNVELQKDISDNIEDFRETSLDDRQLLYDLKMKIRK